LTITPSATNTTSAAACDTYTWSVNGQTYTATGMYTGTTVTCVTQVLNLTITPSSNNVTTISACDTYVWLNNNQTYTASGTYTGTTANCVTQVLNLTITPSSNNVTTIAACDSYVWANNNQTYTTSGIYTGNTVNCITEVLNVTITPSVTNTTYVTACDSYMWPVDGITYTDSDEFSATVGCVTETLVLTINNSTSSSQAATACDTYTWSVNGTTYTTSGTYTYTGTNAAGCTDTKTLVLTINNSTSSVETVTSPTCGTYRWSVNDTVYTASGTYTVTGTNAAGCVDTKTLLLTINPCETVVNVKLFIEGYYDATTSAMRPVLANQGVGASTTNVDTVTIELHNATAPYALVATTTAMLQTDGNAVATFSTAPTGSLYIVVKHRNSVQTWSATAQTVGSAALTYDFTNAANKAFGDNMIMLGSGVYGIYSGDFNQDGYVDIFDFPSYDGVNQSGGTLDFTYEVTDLNGDGYIDIFDFPIYDQNNQGGVQSILPY
jgi:hypothetical protein